LEEGEVKFGLSLNANDSVPTTLIKSREAERLGLDCVWLPDLPSQRYAPVVSAAVASVTHKIQIGLGLMSPFLHTPPQIASCLTTLIESYGARFDLCIGPGDRDELHRAGVDLKSISGIPQHLINSKTEISKRLSSRGLDCRIWLGAQGSRLLEISPFFDGLLLNYASPEMIEWALKTIQAHGKMPDRVGVFAPSYVHMSPEPEILRMLEFASAIVLLGASKAVLKQFSLLESVEDARRELQSKQLESSILKMLPPDLAKKFSIFKRRDELPDYLDQLQRLGVEHVVFSYPQGYSIETMKELAEGLKLWKMRKSTE